VEKTRVLFDLPKLDEGTKYLAIGLSEANYVKKSISSNPCSSEDRSIFKECVRKNLKILMNESCTVPGNQSSYKHRALISCLRGSDGSGSKILDQVWVASFFCCLGHYGSATSKSGKKFQKVPNFSIFF